MTPLVLTLAFLLGAGLGAFAMFATLRARLAAKESELAALRPLVESEAAAEAQLADMRSAASRLRHDLRGILSPALLCADRLANSDDPVVRKAADIVIRSVERASARLADKPAQDEAKSLLE